MIKNIKKIGFVLIATFLLSTLQASADDKTITMVYQVKTKAPYIGGRDKKHKKFDNEGLYKELYTTALKKIGYNLEIKRFPKKVAHKMLKKGKLDFYPMASFSQKRAKYTYYIPNSLKAKDILVSKAGLKEIVGIENIKGRLLVGKGDSKENIDKKYPNIKVVKINKKEFKKGIKFLRQNKADFITTQEKKLQYYLKVHNTSLEKLNIMIHKDALSLKSKSKHLIFSRKSKFFKELPNPDYDKSQPISIKNFPTIISQDCVAYKLMNVLKQMKEDGTTQKLVNKYFK